MWLVSYYQDQGSLLFGQTCRRFAMASASSTQNKTSTMYFDHFTCNICLEVLQDPVQCVKNEHYFCKKCITKHLTRNQTCPVCQDALTPITLRPISRVVANLLQQFQSPKCRYATRGCTSEVKHEALLSHQEECGFAPVQCSHEGCEATVNRQDLVSHQQSCEMRSVTCEECQDVMRQQEYGKHGCFLRKDVDENKRGLAEVQRILREIQEEQLRQGEEMRQMARELRQPSATVHGRQGDSLKERSETRRQQSGNLEQRAGEMAQPSPTGRQGSDNARQSRQQSPQGSSDMLTAETRPSPTLDDVETITITSSVQSQAPVDRQIFVAGGDLSYEIFNWSTQEWSLHQNTLFFSHNNAFSFVYDNKIMICGGTDTNRAECLDIANNRSVSLFPAQLPRRQCGKGVLCGDKILTFGESVSGTSLKPQFKTTVLVPYDDRIKLSSYGVARVNENSVVILGGYCELSKKSKTYWPLKELRKDVLLYNPTTKVMKKLAPLPYELADMAAVVHNDNIIILGGCKPCSRLCDDVLMYNITNQQCSKLPSMLEER